MLAQKYKRGVVAAIFNQKAELFQNKTTWLEQWNDVTLSDVTSVFKSGKSIAANDIHTKGGYPVYGGNGIRGYTDHFSHSGLYVVVGRQGALCGNVRLIDGENYLSEHAIAVRANKENDTQFLMYLLDYMNLGQYSDQGAQPGLAVNKLLRLKASVPTLHTQKHIASILTLIDAEIISNEQLYSFLLACKSGLLQQLFI